MIEQGKMKSITDGVRTGTLVISDEKQRRNTIKNISKFIHQQNKSSGHAKYAYGFLGCLCLSLAVVVFNFYFLNVVFKNKFNNLGIRWLDEQKFSMDNKILKEFFPRMTVCVWNNFGEAGNKQVEHFVCIMAANIINEKIFLFLWFWYILLSVISGGCVLYYCILLTNSNKIIRMYYLSYAVRTKIKKEEVQ